LAHRFCIYGTGHPHASAVCDAVAKGTGFPIVPPAPLREGGMVAYGFLRGLEPTLKQAQQEHRPWVYVDRGYFRASYGGDYTGYFRVTRSAYQFLYNSLTSNTDPARWQRLMVPLAPWRRGRHILVCPPGDVFAKAIGGFDAGQWLRDTLAVLKTHTDRPIRVRLKPAKNSNAVPLASDLADCHALVTFMSNTAVEAVTAGVPVFTHARSAAARMGHIDLSYIETPRYPDDRMQWACALANNQWTLEEIRQGKANGVFA
jgi:hypothetical protein